MRGLPCLAPCRRFRETLHYKMVHVSLALQVAINYEPLAEGFTIWVTLCSIYLAIFVLYWLYCLVRLHSAAQHIASVPVCSKMDAACILTDGPPPGLSCILRPFP